MSALLEVLISLAFLFALFSVLVSAATELVMAILGQRGRTLWQGIRGLLPGDDDGASAMAFLRHPLVQGMGASEHSAGTAGWMKRLRAVKLTDESTRRGATFPSYLSPTVFADTMMHLLRQGDLRVGTVGREADLSALVADVRSNDLRTVLQSLLDSSMDSGVPFNMRLQQWFNESMDRATGSYRRTSHTVMFVVGLCLAVWLNVDTIRIATSLSLNPSLRTGLADKAAAYVEKEVERTATMQAVTTAPGAPAGSGTPMTSNDEIQARVALYNDALNNLQGLGLPIGWGKAEVVYVIAFFYLAIPGWFLTALAASLGANFWFQALGNLVRLRMAGQKPEDSPHTAPVLAQATPSPAMIPRPEQTPLPGTGLEHAALPLPNGEEG